jgi:hypothetical protein
LKLVLEAKKIEFQEYRAAFVPLNYYISISIGNVVGHIKYNFPSIATVVGQILTLQGTMRGKSNENYVVTPLISWSCVD